MYIYNIKVGQITRFWGLQVRRYTQVSINHYTLVSRFLGTAIDGGNSNNSSRPAIRVLASSHIYRRQMAYIRRRSRAEIIELIQNNNASGLFFNIFFLATVSRLL